jgi:hypothetical protein
MAGALLALGALVSAVACVQPASHAPAPARANAPDAATAAPVLHTPLRQALGECVRLYPPGPDREVCVAAAMHTAPRLPLGSTVAPPPAHD